MSVRICRQPEHPRRLAIFDGTQMSEVNFDRPLPIREQALTAAAANTNNPNAGATAATITMAAAGAGIANCFKGIYWSMDQDPAAAVLLTVTDGGTTIFQVFVTKGGPGFLPVTIRGSANSALVISLASGGGTVKGTINLGGRWTEVL